MNATGHMLVGRIAWDNLTPAARSAVQDLNSDPNNPGAGKPTTDLDNDVLSAPVWMDDIRPTYKDLHYVNTPLDGDGTLSPGPNSISFLKENLAVLQDAQASRDEKAEALRITEHLVGDLHQPLHNCDNHDHGGNGFKLNGHQNLHSYWDGGAGLWKNSKRPLDSQSQQRIIQMASQLESNYPMSTMTTQATDLNPEDWAHEGWELAKSDVYTGVTQGQAPSPEYTARAQDDMSRGAALGGYRLANLLNQIFV